MSQTWTFIKDMASIKMIYARSDLNSVALISAALTLHDRSFWVLSRSMQEAPEIKPSERWNEHINLPCILLYFSDTKRARAKHVRLKKSLLVEEKKLSSMYSETCANWIWILLFFFSALATTAVVCRFLVEYFSRASCTSVSMRRASHRELFLLPYLLSRSRNIMFSRFHQKSLSFEARKLELEKQLMTNCRASQLNFCVFGVSVWIKCE